MEHETRKLKWAVSVLSVVVGGLVLLQFGMFVGTRYQRLDHLEISTFQDKFQVLGRNDWNIYGMTNEPYVVTHVFGTSNIDGKPVWAPLPDSFPILDSEGVSFPIAGLAWRDSDGIKVSLPNPEKCGVLYYILQMTGKP